MNQSIKNITKGMFFRGIVAVFVIACALVLSAQVAYADEGVSTQSDEGVAVHRLYNDVTSEHLFTTDRNEAANLANNYERYNWKYEGVGWVAPSSGTPVHRLYNPYLGHHLYTSNQSEINYLCPAWGWKDEGVFYYSGGSVSIYRLYNPFLHGLHLITTSVNEYNSLPAHQWNQEGNMFKGLYNGDSAQAASMALQWYQPGHYEPNYEQRWVSNWVTVVDEPEHVGYPTLGWNYYFPKTGKTIFVPMPGGPAEQQEVRDYYLQGNTGGYTVSTVWGDAVVTPAKTHQEDQGYYEQVQNGTKFVSDGAGRWQ